MTPLIILVPSILGLGQASGCVRERGKDYTEGDIDGYRMGVPRESEVDCAKWCFNNNLCQYWTYSHSEKKCWPKVTKIDENFHPDDGKVFGSRDCGKIASGCQIERGKDYPEGDIDGYRMGINLDSEGDCAEYCFKNGECQWWAYGPNEKKCWLKKTKGAPGIKPLDSDDRVIGNRDCGNLGDTSDSEGNKNYKEDMGDTSDSDGNKIDKDDKGDTSDSDGNKNDKEDKGDTSDSDGNKNQKEDKGDTSNSDGNKNNKEDKGTDIAAIVQGFTSGLFTGLGNLVKG